MKRQVALICTISLCLITPAAPAAFAAHAVHRRALGMVAQANLAHLDGSNAVMGADVYSCDSLGTDEGGSLRLTVGPSQVYLSSNSAAALEDDGSEIQVLVSAGTVGFSEPVSGDISVRTPAGIVRPAGGSAAAGELIFKGPKELIISAMHGDLVLDSGGQLRTIPEGKSADVTFESSDTQGCQDESPAEQQQPKNPVTHPKIGFYIVATGALALPSYFLWRDLTESDSAPRK